MVSLVKFWTAVVVYLDFLSLAISAPAAVNLRRLNVPCTACESVECRYGSARLDLNTNACVCPRWLGEHLRDPCEDMICPYGQGPAFSWMTNQCVCAEICELQECPSSKGSIFSPALGGCACVLDCPALIRCPVNMKAEYSYEIGGCFCETIMEEKESLSVFHKRLEREWEARQVNPSSTLTVPMATSTPIPSASDTNGTSAANFTFIPPPKTDITPALIQQSLNQQPQSLATISSVKPYFLDGVISFGVQLTGLVAATLTMNASTSFPCGSIGQDPEPGLVIVPKTVKQGTPQVTLTSCLIIAINMYNPNYLTWWVQHPDGTLISLLSDTKVHDINLIDQNAPAWVTILTTDNSIPSMRTEVDDSPADMPAGDSIARRAIEEIDSYTAQMSAEACEAITCNNDGGARAIFHPFTRTCYCKTADYVEVDPSGESAPNSK